jgi:hypothetical protein
MNELIEIYNDYTEYNLISDKELSEKLKKKYLKSYIKKYDNYPNLFDFFNLFELENCFFDSIEEYLNIFYKLIEKKIKNDKKSYYEILNEYNFDKYHSLAKFLLDLILKRDDISESDTDEENYINDEKNISNIENDFIFHNNQIRGIEKAIETDFASGIHSQATGCGKTIMQLKIMWEYHIKYPKRNIMWFCERIDIPRSLFFKKEVRNDNKHVYINNKENFDFFRKNDIFDVEQFNIIDFINNKPRKLAGSFLEKSMKINGKPYFIIINRAFATSKSDFRKMGKFYKYEEIVDYTIPGLITFDECHSGMSDKTYEFLIFAKRIWNAKIHGLSATPYRKGISKTSFLSTSLIENIETSSDITNNLDTTSNYEKIINIFHKEDKQDELNIISWCNIKEAIEEGYILEPIFHWYNISNTDNKESNDEIEINSTLSVLNETLRSCQFKKCIVWCRMINLTKQSFDNFKKYQGSYDLLKNMKPYIDYSSVDNNDKYLKDYDSFFHSTDNAILFCACKYREGSDIPFLNCELFLDKVKDRTDIVYIQSIGRVLRKTTFEKKDSLNNIIEIIVKKNGHIIDSISIDNNNMKIKNITMKILKYYFELYDFVFKNTDTKNQLNKLYIFNKILNDIKIEPEKKTVTIMLNNDKKITINLEKLDINTLEWKDLVKHFHKVLHNELEFDNCDKFYALKNNVIQYNFKSDIEYKSKVLELDLPLEPEIIYQPYWEGWYNFLGIDINYFITDINEWKKKIKELNIQSLKQYYELCKINDSIPVMPKEIYKNLCSFNNEYFNKKINRR